MISDPGSGRALDTEYERSNRSLEYVKAGIPRRQIMKSFISSLLLVCILALAFTCIGKRAEVRAQTQGNQPSPELVNPDPWPKSTTVNGTKYTLYEPQLESWDGYKLVGHAAVS